MADEWNFVPGEAMKQLTYRCGLSAGQMIRLRKEPVISDYENRPTGEVHPPGEIWTVMAGSPDEPLIVWLREPNGDQHTWDDDSIWEWFDVIE